MKRTFLLFLVLLSVSLMQAKTALVIIAHGSPSQSWNGPVLRLESKLDSLHIPGIDYCRVALMEYSEPHIATVMADCERQHVDTVFALPLFIQPSSHSEQDIPNILGLRFNALTRAELKEEGIATVHTSMHVVEGPTLNYGDLLQRCLLRQVEKLSEKPDDEALLILAHGDPEYRGFWEAMLEESAEYVRQHTRISYVGTGLVEMGQQMVTDVSPLLLDAAKYKRRILVQGIYLTSSVYGMAARFGLIKQQPTILKAYPSTEVVYGKTGLLPDFTDDICQWIVSTTQEWQSLR